MVLLLYVLLNYVFLYAAPIPELAGKIEVGYIAAQHIFGPAGAKIMGTVLALLLISTVSAMMLAGPRVLQVIGEDFSLFGWLKHTNTGGVPARAIYFQAGIALIFVLTASFDKVLVFAGFTMGCTTLLTVAGVFILRLRKPEIKRPYEAWGYPITPLLFLLLMGWTLIYLLRDKPQESGIGLGILALGFLVYWGSSWWEKRQVSAGRGKGHQKD
jgi:APA family basic amino acid/polyamine antiporter